ncbi:MAG: 2-C-methyl-D-erythritol 4-phosphate cytidylyltransferase [Bacteroidota bacterium]
MKDYQVVAIIPAAGAGQRMNAGINKIWLPLFGEKILTHVLRVFCQSGSVDHIVLVVNDSEIAEIKAYLNEEWEQYLAKFSVVPGGRERQESVGNGLVYLQNWPGWFSERRIVAIHDAARPLITDRLLNIAIAECLIYNAVGVGVPVKDTIKRIDSSGFVESTLERDVLWAIQTPQVFDYDLIFDCYRQILNLKHTFTDECSIAEHCGRRVKLVQGSYENFKITTPEDLLLAEIIMRRRIGANRAGV